ncbi:MAG: AAA family ATPase [Alphaproteobacteria bacterium]
MADDLPAPLSADALCWSCDPAGLDFQTTAQLADLDRVIGQERVVEAVTFAIGMEAPGYNLYALGPEGVGKQSTVRRFLDAHAATRPVPPDLCYVASFDDSHAPNALHLPAGRGRAFAHAMDRFIDDCRASLQSAFEGDAYRTRRQILEEELKDRHEEALADVERDAGEHGIGLLRTPMGFALAPVHDGKVVQPDVFQRYPAEERKRIETEIERLQGRLREVLQAAPAWVKEARDKVRALNEETATFAVRHLVAALRESFGDLPEVAAHIARVETDVIANVDAFLQAPAPFAPPHAPAGPGGPGGGPGGGPQALPVPAGEDGPPIFRRYRVNLLVDNDGLDSAPVVYEDNPTHERLIGRIEHRAEMGALLTDFNLIRAGALHRANGGYLVLDARKVLTNPYAWDGLKQALRRREIRIEPLMRALGLAPTVTLDPEPVPLALKVVLVGPQMVYYLLAQLDPEFVELFKVAADFDESIARSPETTALYARLIATVARREGAPPFAREAVGRVLEETARRAGDSEKLSAHVEDLADLVREAAWHARAAGHDPVTRGDVERAIDAQTRRADRIRERVLEQITRGTIKIATSGAAIGQVNGLAVSAIGGFAFGRPSRITARVRLGTGRVVDIEREVELGGPLHSKGVLILSGYLAARYATDLPLSLAATLVFEQSYGGVDGDSASSTELYALLSAIGEIPIRQGFAVTGSVNQAGEVQAIGGVNEKIEGFFDVCAAHGLTGEQGVLIPAANVVHLMLRGRVVDAVRAGRFRIFPVETIDQGIAILTGLPAGAPGPDGAWPSDSVNGRVEARLRAMAERRLSLGRVEQGGRGAEPAT